MGPHPNQPALHALPKVTEDHEGNPVGGSWYTERTCRPANLLADFDYPIIAVCKTCGARIRLECKLQAVWTHVPADGSDPDRTADNAASPRPDGPIGATTAGDATA